MKKFAVWIWAVMLSLCFMENVTAQRLQQQLGRGVVAVYNGTDVFISWRRLAQDPETAGYNVYVDGRRVNDTLLKTTNCRVASSVVPEGSVVTVTMVNQDMESEPGVPFKMKRYDVRNIFVDITFDQSPLEAEQFNTSYVWPVDLDGDGEMDYVVNRMNLNNALDCYVEAYLRTGEHLWTVKMGPNELICSGQDDQILAYDIDCDGKGEVVMQTSDGTQFWDPDAGTFGLYVNGSTTGDTDGDGIIDYETQTLRNAPRYMTVVDGMTGREKCSVEQVYVSDCYTRTNRSQLMGDEYNKHVGHMGVFYHDGVHPAVVMEYHTRFTDGSHHYYNGAWAFDFSGGKAADWHQLFNEKPGGPAFHQIRIADPDGDGKDEMIVGGYTMDHDGKTLFDTGIAHGDRFRTSDIDPERPGLETFAIQQYAGDMLGQILYDAADGRPIKKWFLPATGDVGRGECMDIDPEHPGWEMWSTMGGVYDAKGDLIPELTAPYPTEGIWWDGDLDREIVQTSDSHYNVYVQDFFKGRLIEIAKLSGYRYLTVYAKRAAFWGDIAGDWREELILRHVENGVCVGITGFTTDCATDVDYIYCLQEDPAYRMQCTTKGYYQSPNTGFYLGYDMPRPQLPPCMVTDVVWKGEGEWNAEGGNFTAYDRSSTVAYADGKTVLFDLTSGMEVGVNSVLSPGTVYVMPVKNQCIRWSGKGRLKGDMDLWKSQQGTLIADIPLDYSGITYISEGVMEVNTSISGKVDLRARGTLAGNATVGEVVFEGALNYEGCRLAPGPSGAADRAVERIGVMTFRNGLNIDGCRVFMEMDIARNEQDEAVTDLIKVTGNLCNKGTVVFTVRHDGESLQPGKYKLIEYTGEFEGDENRFLVNGLKGIAYQILHENKAVYLVVSEQRSAATGVKWTGWSDGNWDFRTENFSLDGQPTGFVANDEVEFTDEAVNTTVILDEMMPVGKVTVNNAGKTYTFGGEGGISGEGALVKTGEGTLILNAVKSDYTGATELSGGTVVVKELADGGIPSSIGAASVAATDLKMENTCFVIDNTNTSTDRGMTLSDNVTIQVAEGTASFKGQITGPGVLVKKGGGQLNITYAGSNTWKGGTVIEGGTLAMGAWNTTFGVPTSKITVKGGTIRIFDNNTSSAIPVFDNVLEVESGKTLTFIGGSRCKIRGRLGGEGTVKISFPYVRGDVSTDMSSFKGTYEVTSGQLRLVRATDLSQATLKLGAGVYVAHYKEQSGTEQGMMTNLGGLQSTADDCTLSTGTYNVGYLGNEDAYSGILGVNATLNKYGNGLLLMNGMCQGKMNVYGGVLSLCNASSSGTVTVNDGAVFIGTGSTSSVTVAGGGMIGVGKTLGASLIGRFTLTGNLNVKAGGIVRVRARKSSVLRGDTWNVGGKVQLVSPVFRIELMSGSFSENDELKIFNADGEISLTGTPVFEPAVPGSGLSWDASSLSTDGCLRVMADPVSVGEIKADKAQDDEIFDLAGRKQSQVGKAGVYIINGKKVKR